MSAETPLLPDLGAQTLDEPSIRLELTAPEVDLVLEALGQCVYVRVAALIAKITAQGLPQAEEIGRERALLAAPLDTTAPN